MFIYRSNHVANCIKRSRVFLLCFMLFLFFAKAQVNLVVDPSMENYLRCPTVTSENEGCYTWHALDSINNTPNALKSCTPVYLNICSTSPGNALPANYGQGYSFMYPRTGNGMYGVVFYCDPIDCNPVYNRDYLRGRLRTALISGQEYCGKYYVSLYKSMKFAVDRLGAYLDNGALDANNECLPIIVTPTFENPALNIIRDTVGWQKIQGTFTANGTETYITIGNFYTHGQTRVGISKPSSTYEEAYYYVDDVSVIPIEIKAFAGNDATICLGDSIVLGRPQEVGIECEWYKPGNPVPFSSNSSLRFKADSVGTYIFIQRMDNCKITFDTVTVKVIQDCNTTLQIPNVFTPNEDGINDAWYFEIKNATNVRYSIYNRWGNLVKDSDLPNHTFVQWDGRTTAGESCSAGVYYFVLSYTNSKGEAQKKNGYVTLIK